MHVRYVYAICSKQLKLVTSHRIIFFLIMVIIMTAERAVVVSDGLGAAITFGPL